MDEVDAALFAPFTGDGRHRDGRRHRMNLVDLLDKSKHQASGDRFAVDNAPDGPVDG
jgi:hypothetical protein